MNLNRYTIKSKENEFDYDIISEVPGDESLMQQFANNKLGCLENLEERFGVNLITLLKAELDGFYYKEDDGQIYWSGNQFIRVGFNFVKTEPCYQVKETTLASCYYGDVEKFKEVEDAHYWDWKTHTNFRIEEYGTKWALTREELEHEEK